MPAPGSVWATDTWHIDAWAANTWADALVGSVGGPRSRLGKILRYLAYYSRRK